MIPGNHEASAKFHPDARHPAIEIAGVLVFAYITPDGLRVSVDLDTADPSILLPNGNVPTTITVQGFTVFKELS